MKYKNGKEEEYENKLTLLSQLVEKSLAVVAVAAAGAEVGW